jgi:Leucine-rich repeat (LRR) protein
MYIRVLLAVALITPLAASKDKNLPEGIQSAGYYAARLTKMTDAGVGFLNSGEYKTRSSFRIEFLRGTTDADFARLKDVPWAKSVHFHSIDGSVDCRHLLHCKDLNQVNFSTPAVSNLDALAKLPKLTAIWFHNRAAISDLEWLKPLRNIEVVSLAGADNIRDYEPLRGRTKIRYLNLNGHQHATVESLAPLSTLVNLTELHFPSYPGRDLNLFARSSKVVEIAMPFARSLEDISALTQMKNLKSLNIRQSQVADLSPLAALENLEYLNIEETDVEDITPLLQLPKLRSLSLANSKVTDITPLTRIETLTFVTVTSGFPADQVAKLTASLAKCRVNQMPVAVRPAPSPLKPAEPIEKKPSTQTETTVRQPPTPEKVVKKPSEPVLAEITIVAAHKKLKVVPMKKGVVRLTGGYKAKVSRFADELAGSHLTVVPWKSTMTYDIVVNKPGYLYAIKGSKVTYEGLPWQPRADFISGSYLKGGKRVAVLAGQRIQLKGYELGLIAGKIVLASPN